MRTLDTAAEFAAFVEARQAQVLAAVPLPGEPEPDPEPEPEAEP